MREVMNEYGRTMLSAVAAVLVLTLLFTTKAFNGGNIIEGTGKVVSSMNVAQLSDEMDTDSSFAMTSHMLTFDSSDVSANDGIIAEKAYSVNDLVKSESGKNTVSVKVLSVKGVSGLFEGQEVTTDMLSGDKINFRRSGIYRVNMRCTNQDGQYFYGNMYISVSPNGGVPV